MSIVSYSRFRRQKLRRAWQFAGMWRWLAQAIALLAALGFLVAGLVWTDNQIARADSAEQRARAAAHKVSHLEQTWVSCLENRSVWIDDVLHICHVVDTRLARSDFK